METKMCTPKIAILNNVFVEVTLEPLHGLFQQLVSLPVSHILKSPPYSKVTSLNMFRLCSMFPLQSR